MGNNIVRGTDEMKWKDPRLFFLKSFVKPRPSTCPECGAELTTTEDEDEIICTGCGLITSMSIEYVAGEKIVLPYGRH
jgi:NAD-dependent DNA ligase